MADPIAILLYGATTRSPELRHEVPLAIVDPFLFVEVDGRPIVVAGELERPRLERVEGQILPGEPITVDIWPRDRATGCHTDMTRTFVCGEPPEQLVRLHALCVEAMELALSLIKPGAQTLAPYAAVCELFERHGRWSPLARDLSRPDELSGFPYALGHGVGRELHEQPGLARGSDSRFLPGEVIAVEPAVYVEGFGGCRIEDIVLVGDGGCRPLTRITHELRC